MDVYSVVLIIDPDVEYTVGNSADRSRPSTIMVWPARQTVSKSQLRNI